MTSRLNPYLSFTDNAREAMTFYQSVLGGELEIMTFGQMGASGTPMDDLVMHAMLTTDKGFTLMGADTPPGMTRTQGDSITVSLSGDDADDLRDYFGGLSEGGEVQTPLETQVWGDTFGALTDRFGVGWLVNIAGAAAG